MKASPRMWPVQSTAKEEQEEEKEDGTTTATTTTTTEQHEWESRRWPAVSRGKNDATMELKMLGGDLRRLQAED